MYNIFDNIKMFSSGVDLYDASHRRRNTNSSDKKKKKVKKSK